jgi:hypothetical protein
MRLPKPTRDLHASQVGLESLPPVSESQIKGLFALSSDEQRLRLRPSPNQRQ